MPEICPKCRVANPSSRSTCVACGAELEIALFAEMFGPPKRLKSGYVIQRAVQRGTNVSIYRAANTKDNNQPCLVHQVTLASLESDIREVIEHRFIQQAAAWQKRGHPNLLRILDADVQSHRLYLITDPVKGISLRSIIADRQQAISEQTLIHWASQICDALEYLHSQDPPIILGCLSPAAIHVDETGHIQIVEVGLVRYKQSGLLGTAKGISGYAAPEQRRGEVTHRSDLYTLGLILYQLVTRFNPKTRPLPPLHKYAQGYSDHVIESIARAYRREPGKRYPSAASMRQTLSSTSIQPAADLPRFTLTEGQAVTTIPGMIQSCVTYWDDGLLALTAGHIVDWLTAAIDELGQTGRDADIVQIEKAIERTTMAGEQIKRDTSQAGLSATAREVARNAVYSSWLQDMGALGVQPSLEARPTTFDFGVVGARIKARSAIQIRNRGQGYLSGRAESSLPWLSFPNSVFGCRAGETVEVQVEVLGRRLSSGDTTSLQAIRITSNGGSAWIEAKASSSPPILSVERQMLDFGPIARGASRIAHLNIANAGGGRLNGRVVSRAPWLRVRHPNFSCLAGASAQIAVELLSGRLPKGAVRIRRALAVDSDSGQIQVDVVWKWARPGLELDTTGLDLGSVERGTCIERTLILSNSGTADLIGESTSNVPWLTVRPEQFRCAPGTSQALSVVCDTIELPGGSTVEAEAIAIRANAGTQTLSASVDVLAAQLIVESSLIDLGDVHDGDQVEQTVMVGNRGSIPWEGQVTAEIPWLSAEPQEIHCEPGHFIPITVMLHTRALESGGEYRDTAAVRIRGGVDEYKLSAYVNLVRPELSIERHSLDVGLIGRTDIVTVPLELTNRGTGELQWEISVQGTWLEIVPSAGTCGAGKTTTVQVKAYALAVDGESGRARLAVRSNGGRIDLPASVALSSPLLVVEPLYLELDSENYESASQTLRISNRGVGDLRGTVQPRAPWLDRDPVSFVCPTGISKQIEINANLEGLREGTYDAADAVYVASNGGSETIQARLILALAPQLRVSVDSLQFGDASQTVFQLENQGYGTLHVQVIPTEDWITVNRREWTIKAGRKAPVHVSLRDAPPAARGSIDIHTPHKTIHLDVNYD